jgi:radical SAM superfamily enzyme YgiQ (UPF0313 family)
MLKYQNMTKKGEYNLLNYCVENVKIYINRLLLMLSRFYYVVLKLKKGVSKISVLLVNFYHNALYNEQEVGEALGIGYLGAYLEKHNFHVDLFDGGVQKLKNEEIMNLILTKKYKLIGFSVSQTTFTLVCKFVKLLRKNGYDGFIVLGGHFVTNAYVEVLENISGIDCISIGEGETTLLNLAETVFNKQNWKNIEGIVYKDKEKIVTNPLTKVIEDLDTLPWPKRIDYKRNFANISSSRGCYGECSYCSISSFYGYSKDKKWRYRSAENVVLEIDNLVKNYGIKTIKFIDDNFIGIGKKGKERAENIAKLLLSKEYKITFSIECRANDIDENLFILLKKAGLRKVFLGIESGVNEDLNIFNKMLTVEKNIEGIKKLFELDIEPNIGFMFFHPYLDMVKIRKNLKFLNEVMQYNSIINVMLLTRLIVQPGFGICKKLKNQGRIEWDHNTHEYRYNHLNTEVELFNLMVMNYYPRYAMKLNRRVKKMKDFLFFHDRYNTTDLWYKKVRNLELEFCNAELKFAEQILEMITESNLLLLNKSIEEFNDICKINSTKIELLEFELERNVID